MQPRIWNFILMTDAAVQLHETNRRLDAIDRKILMVLQEDASLSVAEIGDRVGLSSTPCWKRIQRLEADVGPSAPRRGNIRSEHTYGGPLGRRCCTFLLYCLFDPFEFRF